MPNSPQSSSNALIGLLSAIIVFLLAIFGFLFQSSTPTSVKLNPSVQSVPLGTGNIQQPGQIQGNTGLSPQNAATLTPDDLNKANQ